MYGDHVVHAVCKGRYPRLIAIHCSPPQWEGTRHGVAVHLRTLRKRHRRRGKATGSGRMSLSSVSAVGPSTCSGRVWASVLHEETFFNAQCIMHNAQFLMREARCNFQCTLHDFRCVISNAQNTVHKAQLGLPPATLDPWCGWICGMILGFVSECKINAFLRRKTLSP